METKFKLFFYGVITLSPSNIYQTFLRKKE